MVFSNSFKLMMEPNESNSYLTIIRPLFLLSLSIFLSYTLLLSLFTPLLITLFLLSQTRVRGYLGLLLVLGFLTFSCLKMGLSPLLFFVYLMNAFASITISEIVRMEVEPIRGVICSGFVYLALVTLIFLQVFGFNAKDIKTQMTSKVTLMAKTMNKEMVEEMGKKVKPEEVELFKKQLEENKEWSSLMKEPDKFAVDLLWVLPYSIMVFIFMTLWITMGLTLRFRSFFESNITTKYTLNNFLAFKTSEYLIWPLIISLGVVIGGYSWWPEYATQVARNFLFTFGLFYLFQGFGIFIELLNFLKLDGPFRTLLTILTFITSFWILALIGLFDLWIDFRKLINKKLDRGDIQ